MTGKMKAAVMTTLRKIEIQERDIPAIKENEVLINIKHVGICGSDVHYYEFGHIGNFKIEPPFILGHEAGGEVVEVGENVAVVQVGDRVAIEPGIPCGQCDYCKKGKYNLCPDMKFLATPPIQGVFQEYVAYPANMVFKLPNNVDTMEGALVEPFICGLYAAEDLGEIEIGQTALVFGCGCIGQFIIKSLQAMGITDIYAVDVIPARIEKVKALRIKEVWNGKEVDVVEKVKCATSGRGADIVFEAAGNITTTKQTIGAVAAGGRIVITGMATEPEIPIDIISLVCKEAEIRTQFRYKNLYPKAIKLISEGCVNVKEVVSNICKLEEVPEMFEKCIENKDKVIKAVVEM